MKKKLNEEPTLSDEVNKEAEKEKKQAEAGVDNVIDADSGQIETALNLAYNTAKRQQRYEPEDREWPCIMFIGEPGSGKTSRIKAWAKRHNVNLVVKYCSTMDQTDLGGAPVPDMQTKKLLKLTTTELDSLDHPNSVLFLDEYNRAMNSIRGTMLSLINDHVIPDASQPDGLKHYDNLLFVCAAINPEETSDEVEVTGQAENDRFRDVRIISDKRHWLGWAQGRFDRLIKLAEEDNDKAEVLANQRKKALVTALVSDQRFAFDETLDLLKARNTDGWNKKSLNNRNLTKLLDLCDGTKDNFLDLWDSCCNNLRKPKVEQILQKYEDIDDKANSALKGGSNSAVFGQRKKTLYDHFKDALSSMPD